MTNFFNLRSATVVRETGVPILLLSDSRKQDKRYVAVLNKFGDEFRISVYDKHTMSYPFIKWGRRNPDLMIESIEMQFKKCNTIIIDKRHEEYTGN